jgi:hypothetical protein
MFLLSKRVYPADRYKIDRYNYYIQSLDINLIIRLEMRFFDEKETKWLEAGHIAL